MYGEFDLFIKIPNFDDRVEIWWSHQKSHVTLITVLVFFERSYVVPHSCKVSWLGLNWFRIYEGGGGGFFRAPTLKLFNPLSASAALI